LTTENFKEDTEVLRGYYDAISFYRDHLGMSSDSEALVFLCRACDGQDRIFGLPDNLRRENFPEGFYTDNESDSGQSDSDVEETSQRRVKIVDSSSVQRRLGTQKPSTHPITGSTNIVGEDNPTPTILSPGREVFHVKRLTRQDRIPGIPEDLRRENFPEGLYPPQETATHHAGFQVDETSSQNVNPVHSSSVQRNLRAQEHATQKNTGSTKFVEEGNPQSTILSPGKEVPLSSSSKQRMHSTKLPSIPKKKHASARQFVTRTSTPVEQTPTPSVDKTEALQSLQKRENLNLQFCTLQEKQLCRIRQHSERTRQS
jgi:hypothetical protein